MPPTVVDISETIRTVFENDQTLAFKIQVEKMRHFQTLWGQYIYYHLSQTIAANFANHASKNIPNFRINPQCSKR